jgi:predicted DNA-binding transcriptional regulator YafY
MSKKNYIARYLLIIKKLRSKKHCSYEELKTYIEHQSQFLNSNDEEIDIHFSKRTLQRDLKEIRSTFGIDVMYSKIEKGYYISDDMDNLNFHRMLESFDLLLSLDFAKEIKEYIVLENYTNKSTHLIKDIVESIKSRKEISFNYHKHFSENFENRKINPLAIKEFKHRWYVIGEDKKDEMIKSFGLDRVSGLVIGTRKFNYPKSFSAKDFYRDCFGIEKPHNEDPQEVILSFYPEQGNYIKTTPLHNSQEIIIDNEDELRVKLKVFISYDFIVELLSHGSTVKIIKPKQLIKRIEKELKLSLERLNS